jgi:hypothetical protein
MSATEYTALPRHRGLPLIIRAPWSLFLGTMFALTAVTSILTLGWLMDLMRARAFRTAGLPFERPTWIMGRRGEGGWLNRLLGGLAGNIRRGLHAALCLFIATFPVTVFWMVAWWAGWENSFNKGYEQSFIGPFVGFAGIAVFVVSMVYIPLALAHQAVAARPFAFFDLRRVRSAAAHAGWRYVFWAFSTVFFALPIFASRGLPVFGEGIFPGLADMTPEQAAGVRNAIALATAGYIFVSLVILKSWSAKIYARAVRRASRGPDNLLWQDSPLVDVGDGNERRVSRTGRGIRFAFLLAIWFGLAVLIFVGQFLHYEAHVWLSHPYVFLPWIR